MLKFINKHFGGIEWLVVALFIIALPFIYTTKLLDPVYYTRYYVLSWVLMVLLPVLLFRLFKGQMNFNLTKTEKIIFGIGAVFLLINVISAFGAFNAKEATFHTLKQFGFMFFFIVLVLLLKTHKQGRDVLIRSLILATASFLAIAIAQLLKADFTPFKNATSNYAYYFTKSIFHVKSTLANKNQFSTFLLLSLPFTLYGAICYKKFWRVFSIGIALLSLIFIGILVSKTVWAGVALFFFTITVFVFIYLFWVMPKETGKHLPLWAKSIIIATPFLLIAGGIILVKKSDIKIVKIVVDKVEQVFNPDEALSYLYSVDNPTSWQTRVLVWSQTMQMAKDNPVIGVGPGNWRLFMPSYGLDGYEDSIRQGSKHFQRPHNDFLWVASELGFPGLIVFLCFFFSFFYLSFKKLKTDNNFKHRIFYLLTLATLFTLILVFFVTFSRERITHNVAYLSLFALVVAGFSTNGKAKKVKPAGKAKIISLLFVPVVIFNIVVAKDYFKGDMVARDIQVALMQKNWVALYRASSSIEGSYYTIDPFTTPLYYYQGRAQHMMKRQKDAKASFEKAYKIHPYHLLTIVDLATSYNLVGNNERAIELYQKALDVSPRFHQALLNLAIVYYNEKDYKKAMDYILRISQNTEQKEKYRQAVVNITRLYAIKYQNRLNRDKLIAWVNDENKVMETFVRFKGGNVAFDKIIVGELGR